MATAPSYITNNTNDPRKIAQNVKNNIATVGNNLYANNTQSQNQNEALRGQTADYLNGIEDPLAQGKGGYNAQEVSQIEMTPEQQAAIATGAGITAGANTAASTGAAERAADAAGGSPLALAAYRQRAAQQIGSQAGDAVTQAKIGAQQAASGETQAVGNARLNQQNQGLNYYQNQNQQANQDAEAAAGRNQQTYATQTGGENAAANTGVTASQTPTTFDKVIGAVSSLEDGGQPTKDAVVGEGGPEEVVKIPGSQNNGAPWWHHVGTQVGRDIGHPASDSRIAGNNSPQDLMASRQTAMYLEDGDYLGDAAPPAPGSSPDNPDTSWSVQTPQANQSVLGKIGAGLKKMVTPQPGATATSQPQTSGQQSGQWNPATPAKQIGQIGGKLLSYFLEDGGKCNYLEDGTGGEDMEDAIPQQGANGIFTQPTHIKMASDEMAVPLGYKAGAKVRPSMAAMLPPAPRQRMAYQ